MPKGGEMGGSGRGMGGSGGGAGFCAGYDMPGFANPTYGRGFGTGSGRGAGFFGGGHGWRRCFNATGLPGWMRFGGCGYPGFAASALKLAPEMERQALKSQADALEAELGLIKQRLCELEESE